MKQLGVSSVALGVAPVVHAAAPTATAAPADRVVLSTSNPVVDRQVGAVKIFNDTCIVKADPDARAREIVYGT
jgi:hypothetical protein